MYGRVYHQTCIEKQIFDPRSGERGSKIEKMTHVSAQIELNLSK